MIPLLDYSAIEEMRKRLAGGQGQPPAGEPQPPQIQPMAQAPIQAPPQPQPALLQPPPDQMAQVPESGPIRNDLPNIGLLDRPNLLSRAASRVNDIGKPRLSPGMRSLLSADEADKAESGGGLLGRLAAQAISLGMWTPGIQAQMRAEGMLADKDALAKRTKSKQFLKDRASVIERLGPAPRDEDYSTAVDAANAKALYARKVFLDAIQRGDVDFARLAGMSGYGQMMQMENEPRQVAPQQLQRQDNVLGKDGKPYIVWTDVSGKEVKREPQFVSPKAEPSDPLVQVLGDDGTPIWMPRSMAAGRKAVTSGNRADTQGRIKREDELRTLGDDLTNIDNAVQAVKDNPSAFGLKNTLPAVVRQRLPGRDNAKDAGTIGSLEYVVGRLRHDRFGGALTPLEASKAARIFAEPTSPPEVVQEQLNIIRNAVARKKQHLQAVVGSDGSKANIPSFEEWKQKNGASK